MANGKKYSASDIKVGRRPNGGLTLKFADRSPTIWPRINKGTIEEQLVSAILRSREQLGTSYTDAEAKKLAGELAKKAPASKTTTKATAKAEPKAKTGATPKPRASKSVRGTKVA